MDLTEDERQYIVKPVEKDSDGYICPHGASNARTRHYTNNSEWYDATGAGTGYHWCEVCYQQWCAEHADPECSLCGGYGCLALSGEASVTACACVEIIPKLKKRIAELEAQLSEKQSQVNLAIRIIEEPCGACKDCDPMCATNILLRILRGQPSTLCSVCGEWWDGPIEFEDTGLGFKEIDCPACVEFMQSDEGSEAD